MTKRVISSLMSEYHDAVRCQCAAVELFAQIEDAAGAASAHNNLARALQSLGRLDEAFAEFATAVEIYRRIGDLSGQGRALGSQAGGCMDSNGQRKRSQRWKRPFGCCAAPAWH